MASATIPKTTAQRFLLGRQGLWPGRRWIGQEGTAVALRMIEEVQIYISRYENTWVMFSKFSDSSTRQAVLSRGCTVVV